MIDLVCLVADKNMEAVIESLVSRCRALAIRPVRLQLLQHPRHDPGCYHDPVGILRPYASLATHAMVVLDRAWQGVPQKAVTELESDVEARFTDFPHAWMKCIVIDPELEAWLFTRSHNLSKFLGWESMHPDLHQELEGRGHWPAGSEKPHDPKSAMQWALSHVGKQKSSSIYRQIASQIGIGRCTDLSFGRFRRTLQGWFPAL